MKSARIIIYISLIPILPYIYMMCIKPWFDSGFNWQYVQSVWSYWQTLNAGMIAFTASIVALFVVSYKEIIEHERKLFAAKALLPNALCDLMNDCEYAFKLLKNSYNKKEKGLDKDCISNLYLEGDLIDIPDGTIEILKECIISSDKEDGQIIAKLLSDLQIMHSRLQSIHIKNNSRGELLVNRLSIENHITDLAHIVVSINRLFPFARMQKKLYKGTKQKEEVITALHVIGCNNYEFPNIFNKVKNDKYLQ